MSVLSEKQRLKIIFSLQVKSVKDCLTRDVGPYEVTELTYAAEQLFDAIEAAVLPEGWVAVPRIVTPAIEAVYGNDSGAYGTAQELHDAMLAATPKPAPPTLQEAIAKLDGVLGNAIGQRGGAALSRRT